MIWIYGLSIFILIYIAIIDFETEEIPHTFTIILLLLGISSVIVNRENWVLPVVVSVITFILYAILFFVTGKIGGGDVKILSISLLFFPTASDIFVYFISFAVCIMAGILYMCIKNKKSLRLGPYMALGLILSFVYLYTNSLMSCLFASVVFVFFIFCIDTIHFKQRRLCESEKIF